MGKLLFVMFRCVVVCVCVCVFLCVSVCDFVLCMYAGVSL